jgi:hypothetical protein
MDDRLSNRPMKEFISSFTCMISDFASNAGVSVSRVRIGLYSYDDSAENNKIGDER